MQTQKPLSYQVIGCALEVYKTLGPGLMESVYEKALIHELSQQGMSVKSQVEVEMNYKGINIGEGLRLDILVNDELIDFINSINLDLFKTTSYLPKYPNTKGVQSDIYLKSLMLHFY